MIPLNFAGLGFFDFIVILIFLVLVAVIVGLH